MKAIRRILALLFLLLLNVMAATPEVSPEAGAIDVPKSSIVTALFAEPLDPASVTQQSIRLKHYDELTLTNMLENIIDSLLGTGADPINVEGTVAYDAETRTLSFTPNEPLRAGEYRAILSSALRYSDGRWVFYLPMQWNFTVGEGTGPELTELSITADASEVETGQTTALHAQGHYSDGSVADLTDTVAWSSSDGAVATVDADGTLHGVAEGTLSVTAAYEGTTSNALSIDIVAPAPVLQRLDMQPSSLTLSPGETAQLNVRGHYSDGTSRDVTTEAGYTVSDTSVVSVSGGSVTAIEDGTATVTAALDGVTSNGTAVTVSSSSVDTGNFPPEGFADTYKDTIPADATAEQYDPERFCVLTGLVKGKSGSPLPGVRVSLFGHPEYGSALTDEAGRFEIAAEGGGIITVVYAKAGFATLHRQVDAPWKDIVVADTVTMLERDTASTSIALDGSVQTHVSTPVSDGRGERGTTLVFDGVTGATVTNADGHRLPLRPQDGAQRRCGEPS